MSIVDPVRDYDAPRHAGEVAQLIDGVVHLPSGAYGCEDDGSAASQRWRALLEAAHYSVRGASIIDGVGGAAATLDDNL